MAELERRRKFFRSLEAKSLKARSFLTRLADELTSVCGSPTFLVMNSLFFLVWIGVNTNILPGFIAFDPYPFGLLTMIVSLEAIFLSIFVLISQNRSAYISTIRDEVHMQVNLRAEEEITKILEILSDMRKKMGITKEDAELKEMLERMDTGYIEQSIAGQLSRANKPIFEQMIREFPDVLHRRNQENGTKSSETNTK